MTSARQLPRQAIPAAVVVSLSVVNLQRIASQKCLTGDVEAAARTELAHSAVRLIWRRAVTKKGAASADSMQDGPAVLYFREAAACLMPKPLL